MFIGPDQIGERLRAGRTQRGLSQRKLAQLVGVSPSLVSQMESGKVQPSVATLMSVVTELGLSIDQLFRVNGPADGRPAPAPDGSDAVRSPSVDQPTVPQNGPELTLTGRSEYAVDEQVQRAPRMVQRSTDRSMIRLQGGVIWERLTPDPDHLVDFLHITYEPGACSSDGDHFLRHEGREYLYILSGQLEVQVVFESTELQAGDSIAFDSMRPHRLTNKGDVPAVAIVAVVHP